MLFRAIRYYRARKAWKAACAEADLNDRLSAKIDQYRHEGAFAERRYIRDNLHKQKDSISWIASGLIQEMPEQTPKEREELIARIMREATEG